MRAAIFTALFHQAPPDRRVQQATARSEAGSEIGRCFEFEIRIEIEDRIERRDDVVYGFAIDQRIERLFRPAGRREQSNPRQVQITKGRVEHGDQRSIVPVGPDGFREGLKGSLLGIFEPFGTPARDEDGDPLDMGAECTLKLAQRVAQRACRTRLRKLCFIHGVKEDLCRATCFKPRLEARPFVHGFVRIGEGPGTETLDAEEERFASGCADGIDLMHEFDGFAGARLRQQSNYARPGTQPYPIPRDLPVREDFGPGLGPVGAVRPLEPTIEFDEVLRCEPHRQPFPIRAVPIAAIPDRGMRPQTFSRKDAGISSAPIDFDQKKGPQKRPRKF